MKEDVVKTKNAGMNEHLNKPIEIEKLYKILLKYILKKVDIKAIDIQTTDDYIIPEFKTIDTSIGLSHMGRNKKLYLKILNDFYTNNKDLKINNLQNDELTRTIHTIKGLSSNIGAMSLNVILIEIENTMNKSLFPKFTEELNKVLTELKDLSDLNKDKHKPLLAQIDSTSRDQLFNSLKESASKRKANQCKEIISELNKYKLSYEDNELLLQIQELLNKRKYKDMAELI